MTTMLMLGAVIILILLLALVVAHLPTGLERDEIELDK